jgi:hypothetical protein
LHRGANKIHDTKNQGERVTTRIESSRIQKRKALSKHDGKRKHCYTNKPSLRDMAQEIYNYHQRPADCVSSSG